MGIVLVLGFAFLASEVARRMMASGTADTPSTETVSPGLAPQGTEIAAPGPAQRVGLGLPPGSRIAATAAADGRLALHLILPDGGEEVWLIDPASGRPLLVLDPTAE